MRIQPAFTDREVAFGLSHHGDAFVKLYSTVQKKCKRNLPKYAKLREFRQSNCELSLQTKKRRNFGASIVLISAKFRKQGD